MRVNYILKIFMVLFLMVSPIKSYANIINNCTGFSEAGWTCFDSFTWTSTGGDEANFVVTARINDDGDSGDDIFDSFNLHVNVGADEKLGIFALEFGANFQAMGQTSTYWSVYEHSNVDDDLNDLGTPMTQSESPDGALEYDFEINSLTAGHSNNNFNGLGGLLPNDGLWDVLFGFDGQVATAAMLNFDSGVSFDINELIDGFGLGLRAQVTGDDNEGSFKGYAANGVFVARCTDPNGCDEPDDPPDEIPEPNIILLLGTSLLVLCINRKRKQPKF